MHHARGLIPGAAASSVPEDGVCIRIVARFGPLRPVSRGRRAHPAWTAAARKSRNPVPWSTACIMIATRFRPETRSEEQRTHPDRSEVPAERHSARHLLLIIFARAPIFPHRDSGGARVGDHRAERRRMHQDGVRIPGQVGQDPPSGHGPSSGFLLRKFSTSTRASP